MKKSRFTEVQVVQALQKHESGIATGVKPRNGHRTRHLLQVEGQIRGVGCVRCPETQNPGRGAFAPQKDVRRPGDG